MANLGSTKISGDLIVDGIVEVDNEVDVNGALNVNGEINVSGHKVVLDNDPCLKGDAATLEGHPPEDFATSDHVHTTIDKIKFKEKKDYESNDIDIETYSSLNQDNTRTVYLKYTLNNPSENCEVVYESGSDDGHRTIARLTSNNHQVTLSIDGNITGRKVYNAVYNDYAEWFEKESEENFEPGDIVSWHTTGVVKSSCKYDKCVIGVYSDNYGHILGGENLNNMEDNVKKFVPVGLCGRVDVKVIGKVKVGDLITTSKVPGVGMKAKRYKPGTVIGKALESYDGKKGIKKIKIMILNK